MDWEEIFKNLNQKEIDDAEEDIDWILTALRDPTYLMVKKDNSNQFLLKHGNTYYVEYVKKVLEERGYILKQGARFSNAVSVVSEREARQKLERDIKMKATPRTNSETEIKPISRTSESEGFEPGDD